jgi:two-component system NtrC family sensor kinase
MNAIDAMPRGGNLWIETRMSSDEAEVEILVRDDGAGIAPDVLEHIFEPFLTTKERGHGVGLGLAISRGIVERHNGRIEVQSELGKGTTFTVSLPNQTPVVSLANAAPGNNAKS